ncbi:MULTISPECIES: Type 1 glutamine amidotransferase-like domain-containing protein [Nocardiaceae]|uniref:Type 1 glutamine amidotransferase-like domain-containing protein n=1 Tax=Rhodococcoides kroppenstedtii TaxID=293050 RepID=A0ABS7NPY8_9NOCA|nr:MULTISPECIES: Type 1 glutamine amidotransferase-like domain-containing protein [Rhodococcus]AMY18170.1 putative peptidase [Rhodococcus sp. PBTS 1]MBY6313763.1 Type 1 glutamine amidotransferase-like domain-containing protein [Rhodococcus kroppenstedtii]MBY6320079.1 Type 1 glutamine amidotransferase-like domain-containing protein [Rhodococcus kroppenstedtii]MBY6399018.1 Type 1 glutamine amidotransferase-like domain-containing protein [Rhodococcus kroppenstedtii]
MRLFLASYRFGAHGDRLLELVGTPGRIGVVAAAADAWPVAARTAALTSDVALLTEAGFDPVEIDLRAVTPTTAEAALAGLSAVWVRGGNTFVLRHRLATSGVDHVLRERLRRDDLVYAGYSAGACVMGPSLTGIDAADPPAELAEITDDPVQQDGLGVIDDVLVPHWSTPTAPSALDPDGAARAMADACRAAGVRYRTLTDDQVFVRDGDDDRVL